MICVNLSAQFSAYMESRFAFSPLKPLTHTVSLHSTKNRSTRDFSHQSDIVDSIMSQKQRRQASNSKYTEKNDTGREKLIEEACISCITLF